MLAGDILLMTAMYAIRIEVEDAGTIYSYPFSEVGLVQCYLELGHKKAKAKVYKRPTREFIKEVEFDTKKHPGIESIALSVLSGLDRPTEPGLFNSVAQVLTGFDVYVLIDNFRLRLSGEADGGISGFVTEDGRAIFSEPSDADRDCMVYLYPKGLPTSNGHSYMADSEETTIGRLEENVIFMANRSMWRALGTMIGLDGCAFDVISPLLVVSCFLSK